MSNMNCGHCNWYESKAESESDMNGYCSFTSQTIQMNHISGTEEPACREKTFAEWEREQGMRPGILQGMKQEWGRNRQQGFQVENVPAEGEGWQDRAAASIVMVPTGRPASMMPSSEWRLGYLKRLRDKPSAGMRDRLATI